MDADTPPQDLLPLPPPSPRPADRQVAEVRARTILRLIAALLSIALISLALGIAFFLIAWGTVLILARLALYWKAFQALAIRIARLPPGNSAHPRRLTWWRVPVLLLWLALGGSMIYVGTTMLLQGGFCNQNLLCALAFSR